MRCLKCGYISFDFNQTCPKCNKDISEHQDKMYIPSFRPNPPFLLGALVGEPDESDMGIDISGASEPIPEPESHATFDESLGLNEDIGLSNAQDINMELESDVDEVSLEESVEISTEENVLDLDLQTDEEVLSFEPEAITSEEPAPIGSTVEPETKDAGISLDLEDLSFESEEIEIVEVSDEPEAEIPVGLDDITLDEGQEDLELGQVKEEEPAPEIASQELAQEEKSVTDEIELKLDELKINETGDIEIETTAEAESRTDEGLASAEISSNNELDLSDDSLETEDISLDEFPGDDELSLDENVGLDDLISDKSKSAKETPQETTLDLNLDLENLDLDLDLDNPEEK